MIDEIKASFDSKIRDYTYDDKTYTEQSHITD